MTDFFEKLKKGMDIEEKPKVKKKPVASTSKKKIEIKSEEDSDFEKNGREETGEEEPSPLPLAHRQAPHGRAAHCWSASVKNGLGRAATRDSGRGAHAVERYQ